MTDYKSVQEIEDNPAALAGAVITEGKTHKKEGEVFATNGVYRLGPPESSSLDDECMNQNMPPKHPAIKHLGHAMTRGLEQEAWSQWLGEIMLATNISMVGFTLSDLMCDREPTTSPHMMVGLPQPKAKEPQVCARTPRRTRTGQLPSYWGNYQDHSRQNTWSRITNEKKVCQETMVYMQRSFKQTPNSIKEW